MDVALVSCLRLSEPDPDAAPLAAALAAAGLDAAVVAWDDPAASWSAPLTVLRSAWNYPDDRDGFLQWGRRVAATSDLWNPLPVISWNSHKRYLLDLAAAGVPVTPTEILTRGSDRSLADVQAATGWTSVVVKPAISTSSWLTMRIGPDDRDRGERHLRRLVANRETLVQPYLPSVEGHGERALVWIDGTLTHAVRKHPRWHGEDEAVTGEAVPITPAEAEVANRALAVIGDPLMYGRVDVAPGPDGSPVVMELELVEPSLYFDQSEEALDRFVAAILARLG